MRYYYNRKATTNESCRLTMSYLKKRGMLTGEESIEKISWTSSMTGKTTVALLTVNVGDDPHIRIVYAVTDRKGNKTDYDCEASLLTTDCNFGGVRYWFGCPSCGRRVAVLYLAPGDVYFRCRNCNNLSYRSRNRCRLESWGETSRQIERLQSEIKRWTWRGRPTRKVRRLETLKRKAGMLGAQTMTRLDRFKDRLR